MQYALWIGLAVVLIAIGPALIRNMRNAGKRGSSTDVDADAGHSDGDGGDGGGD